MTAQISPGLYPTPPGDALRSTPATRGAENAHRGPKVPGLVSVVVPCKNDVHYLEAALQSILSQDYPHIECIVVDGGSTDGTIELLNQYGERIRWLSEPDNGAFDAINRGWKLSQGEILAWLNADNLWEPGAVSAAVGVFESQQDVDVVYGIAGVVDEQGRFLGDLIPATWNLEYALRHCDHIIFQAASFMRRRIIEKVGWLYPAWCHDHDLWLRIARAGGRFVKVSTRLGMDRLRSEDLGRLADIVVPAKIGLTKRFFADPELSPEIRRLRGRAMSSAYVRGVDYLRAGKPQHWLWAACLVARAVILDPCNVNFIVKRCRRVIRSRTMWPMQWLGRSIERVFARGNRELKLEIAGLRRQLQAIVQVSSETSRPVVARLDRLAEEFAEDWLAVVNQVESLRSKYEGLRRELQLARESTLIQLSEAPCQIYGTPPTLRRTPRWHAYGGTEDDPDPLLRGRLDLWSSLKSPVLMRWFADLLVMIWPGNELSRVLFLTGNVEQNELSWMSQALTNGMTMIDIGAHMGLYSMIASKLVGESGMIIALEPSIREFQRLSFHVTLNDLKNVRCFQVAASDTPGEATLKIAWEWNSGHNTFGENFGPAVEMLREERVRTQTVDALVAAQALHRVDLLKIDVEGHELKVLMGCVETLRRFRPCVLIDVFEETPHRQGNSVEALLALFESHRYVLKEFSDISGKLVPFSRSTDNQSRNLVALPRGT